MPGYYFRLPAITLLTIPQQAALNEPGQIALSGGPGTGKSVVSLWRHIRNYQKNPVPKTASYLSTYTTTLKAYLASCCKSVRDDSFPDSWELSSRNVGTSLRNFDKIHQMTFSEVIIDEAQDLENDYYAGIASPVSYGADDTQILYPEHCSTQSDLQRIFPENISFVLDKNFRSTQRIMQFAKLAFPHANIPQNIIIGLSDNVGEKPVLLITNSFEKKRDAIGRIINSFRSDDHNIAILVPWKDDVKGLRKNVLQFNSIPHSLYYEDKSVFPHGCGDISNVHITTFKSSKGLEFDTVIIPIFDDIRIIPKYFLTTEDNVTKDELRKMETTITHLHQLGRNHDIIISKTINVDGTFCVTYKKLICSWEDMYVACTRAKSNLYLISNIDIPELNNVVEKEIL